MFDFAAFRAAVEGRDAERWLAFFADDAEWLEYRHSASSPRVHSGREAIARYLGYVGRTDAALAISNELVGDERAAFTLTATRPDGRVFVVENTILDLRDGLIARVHEVEAWD
jgi:ketosteroid isomerase-like protein